jgi:glycosyltransferase involved in cell wall biosynthesis
MVEYGKNDKLSILIPEREEKEVVLSENVKVYSVGGGKVQQFFNIIKKGIELSKIEKIDLITTQDPFFAGFAGCAIKKRAGLDLEVQLHGDFFGSSYYKKSGFKNLIQYFLAKLIVLKKADKIRVVGGRVKNSLLGMGIEESKIYVKPVQEDVEYIKNYESKINLHEKYSGYNNIFLSIGRLEKIKNIDFLIDVFAEVFKKKQDCLLLIVGSGTLKIDLENKVKELKLENNIKFEDWTQDPLSYIKTCNCVLFPSFSEGYGLVPMEANILGKNIIMNDVGVANYELKPSDKVKILPVNDKDVWVSAILNV